MSESLIEQMLRNRLDEVRLELTNDGWEILARDRLADSLVPTQLIELEPDIVARKGSELLVGEVKSRNSSSLQALNTLADAVAELPNVRLEVYWLGDESQLEPAQERIRELADEATTLLKTGHLAAAVVTAWAAFEGALERFAADARPRVAIASEGVLTAWGLLSQLYSLGFINKRDFERLTNVRKQRNAAVHFGANDPPPNAQDIEYALRLTERMANGQYVSVDQMMEWYITHHDYPKVLAEDTERGRVFTTLAEHFTGVPESDVVEATTRLFRDAL